MIKYTITTECEDDFDRDAIVNAVKNKLLLEGIYDEVFRLKIKYGSEKEAEKYGEVWEHLKEYLND
jgi:hypothetical protein